MNLNLLIEFENKLKTEETTKVPNKEDDKSPEISDQVRTRSGRKITFMGLNVVIDDTIQGFEFR